MNAALANQWVSGEVEPPQGALNYAYKYSYRIVGYLSWIIKYRKSMEVANGSMIYVKDWLVQSAYFLEDQFDLWGFPTNGTLFSCAIDQGNWNNVNKHLRKLFENIPPQSWNPWWVNLKQIYDTWRL